MHVYPVAQAPVQLEVPQAICTQPHTPVPGSDWQIESGGQFP